MDVLFSARQAYRDLMQHWPTRIEAAINAGSTVQFFLTERQAKFYYTGTRNVSGTGRNQQVTNHVSEVSNYDFLPVRFDKASYAKGRAMILDSGADLLSGFWSQFGGRMNYNWLFEIEAAKP